MNYPWMRLCIDAWFFSVEASNVVALRSMTFALGGPHAKAESLRMIDEKIRAFAALQGLLVSGAFGFTAPQIAHKSLRHYRKSVRQNFRRLSRG